MKPLVAHVPLFGRNVAQVDSNGARVEAEQRDDGAGEYAAGLQSLPEADLFALLAFCLLGFLQYPDPF